MAPICQSDVFTVMVESRPMATAATAQETTGSHFTVRTLLAAKPEATAVIIMPPTSGSTI